MNHFKPRFFLTAALAMLAALPATSYAQQLAYVSKEVNLRAGPSSDYPVVAILGAGVSITVEGCMSDYQWCDVSVGPHRGWVYAGNIIYPYQGSNVPVLTYGAAIGIGVIAFSIGHYWDDYYRARPWYPQRQHWIDRPHPVFRPGFQHPPPLNPGFGPGLNQRPPAGQFPAPGPRPPGGQRPGAEQRPAPGPPLGPPLGPNPGAGGRPPPGLVPGAGHHPHQGLRPDARQRPGERHGQTGGHHP